uniref:Dynein axonemal assembly factor 8 n=1 Tax=Neovison vison TaxID=452646 RepID=A0A8C7A6H0_NEOVI
MASPDKDEESSSLWAFQTEPWDAILKAVREQLPSLDSDSSLSDCGPDELFIFQRDQTALIPDLSEELAEDPARPWLATADGPSEVCRKQAGVVSVELTGRWSKGGAKTKGSASVQGGDPDGPAESCGETSSLCRVPADIPTWEEGDHGALSFSTQGSPWGPHREATFSPWEDDLKTEPPGAASPAGWSTDSKDHRAPRRERRKMIEKDILHKVTWDAHGPACSDRNPVEEAMAGLRPETPPEGPREGPLVLSLKELEEWDLDHILQSLAGQEGDRGDHAPRATWWAANHLGRDHSRPNCQDRLMEQLTLLCAAQSQAPSADIPQDTTQHEARSRSAAGIQAELGLAQSRQLRSPAEPPTIFIDLRPSEPSERYWDPSPSSFDSQEEEEETVALRDAGPPPSPRRLRDCTGKSQLLQQLRAFRKETAQPNWPATGGPSGPKAQVPEDPASSATRRKQHVPAWAEPQNIPARHPGGGPRALGDALGPGTAREALVPPLSQP